MEATEEAIMKPVCWLGTRRWNTSETDIVPSNDSLDVRMGRVEQSSIPTLWSGRRRCRTPRH